MAGSQHSMAGQSIAPGGLYLNMKGYNKILSLDKANKTLKVQSGATWIQIQNFLDPKGLAVDVMQNFNLFTVGGSLSVNAIGWNTQSSAIASTVKSLLVLTSEGEIIKTDRTTHPELFSLILGGYGLLGIILEAEIQLVDNAFYQTDRHVMSYDQFPSFFDHQLMKKNTMMQTFLSLDTSKLLKEVLVLKHTQKNSSKPLPGMYEVKSHPRLETWVANIFHASKSSPVLRKLTWLLQKTLITQSISKRVTRNQLMSAPIPSLLKDWSQEALIIQTYFVPKNKFVEFIDRMRPVLQDSNLPIVSASVIHTQKDHTAFLSAMSNGDRFAITLLFIQERTAQAHQIMDQFSRLMIHEATQLGGTVYLAHRPSLTRDSLRLVYPRIDHFLELKKKYDPQELFSNKFYDEVMR